MYFIDDLRASVPEFEAPESDATLRELPSIAVGSFAIWIRSVLASPAPDPDVLQRACNFLNRATAERYSNQDIENDICVSFFWVLDYGEIRAIAPHLSEAVLDLGRNYLKQTDGPSFEPF